jgi:hypothetical protein
MNGMEILKELHQSGPVDEYIEQIERLRTILLLENHLFTDTDFTDVFIGGLKSDIKAFVKIFRPQNLDVTYEYVFHMKNALDTQYKNLRQPLKQFSQPPPPKLPSSVSTSKNTCMDQRKLLGLCFKCGKKYFLGHHCKVKVQMLLSEEPIDPQMRILL